MQVGGGGGGWVPSRRRPRESGPGWWDGRRDLGERLAGVAGGHRRGDGARGTAVAAGDALIDANSEATTTRRLNFAVSCPGAWSAAEGRPIRLSRAPPGVGSGGLCRKLPSRPSDWWGCHRRVTWLQGESCVSLQHRPLAVLAGAEELRPESHQPQGAPAPLPPGP